MIRERALKIVLVLVGAAVHGRRFSRGRFLATWFGSVGLRRRYDDEPVFCVGDFPADGGTGSGGPSQSDCLCRMVEFCACRGYDDAGIPTSERTKRIRGWLGRAGCHRDRADCPGSSTGKRARICGWIRSACAWEMTGRLGFV